MFSALWMLTATGCFTLMALIIKLQSTRFGVGDLLFLRLAFSAAWVLLLQPFLRFELRTRALGLHARRAALGCLAMGAWYHTLTVLPMGISVTLNYMSPLFLGLLLLGTRREQAPSAAQGALLALGFAGVLIMMSPWASSPAPGQAIAFAIGLAGALFSAMAFKDVKALKASGQSEWQMVFYFSLLGAALALPFTRLWQLPATATAGDFMWFALAGLLGAMGQLGVSKAFGRGDPMVPASLQYMNVVLSLLLGWWLFQERLDVQHLCGIAIVIVAAIATIAVSTRTQRG